MSNLEQELSKLLSNKRQAEAYFCEDNCVVKACPGSGKTATLSLKVMKLLEEIPPPQGLACLTFNREAVREFRSRLAKLGIKDRENLFLGTVHSFCANEVLRPFGKIYLADELPEDYRIASETEVDTLFEKAMDRAKIEYTPWLFRKLFNAHRRLIVDRSSPEWAANDSCVRAIEIYEKLLRDRKLIDFDDQILLALRLIESVPFVRKCLSAKYPWLVVDEYQDLGYALHRIVLALISEGRTKVFAVGDPDQSIYSFMGAQPKYLEELSERQDVKSVSLELNYRCGQTIIDGAEVVLDLNVERNMKAVGDSQEKGEINFIERSEGFDSQVSTIIDEVVPGLLEAGIEPKNIGILYVDKNDGVPIMSALYEAGVQYTGEKDQRYIRSPLTRWLESIALWCMGAQSLEKIRFSVLTGFWQQLLIGAGHVFNASDELEINAKLFRDLSYLRNPEMKLSDWIEQVNQKIALKTILEKNKKRPDELAAYESFVSSVTSGKLIEYTVADLSGCGPLSNRVCVTTLHSSKGLQFDAVIIPGLEDGRVPAWWVTDDADVKEARRLFYVGLTRARKYVYLMYSGFTLNKYGRKFAKGPSKFVKELMER